MSKENQIELKEMIEKSGVEEVIVPSKKKPFELMKIYVRYGLFALVMCVMIYSIIMTLVQPNEGAQKERNKKVEGVLQGLYKLIQATQHLPTLGAISGVSDPLDALSANIFQLLDSSTTTKEPA